MYNINSKYEVLYSDLRNHNIGSFLASREFKLYMTQIGQYETWMKMFKQTESERTIYIMGSNHEIGDSEDTFGKYLNVINGDHSFENFIARIIGKFIEYIKEKTNFSDVLESAKVAGFNDESLSIIQESIKLHENKEFPEKHKRKEVTEVKKEESNLEKQNVFIVHGHNQELKLNVARVLEKLKLTPVILHEQSNEGLTIIEKFEKHSKVSFAVVLLTFDDYGFAKSGNDKNKRARQNVVLELGYFLAKLGRKNVMPLYEDGVELPSDISGVLYTKFDSTENWKYSLVKELKAAGFKVDANDIL